MVVVRVICGNDFARNVVIFGVDNTSSSHTDDQKGNFIVLAEQPTHEFKGSLGTPEKKSSIRFSKAKTKLCLGLHYNNYNTLRCMIIVICLLMEKKSLIFQPNFV